MAESQTSREELWKHELQLLQQELWASYDADQPQRLYHYSRMEGIQGILTSGEIWLRDVRRMEKDPIDGLYGLDVFRPIIEQHQRVPDDVKRVFADTDLGLATNWNLYVACFSAKDNLANQWDSFAAGKTGCAIEIDVKALSAGSDGWKRYGLLRLLYDKGEQRSKAAHLIQEVVRLACKKPKSDRKRYWRSRATFAFLVCGQRFKRPDYAKEDEWRLAIAATDDVDLRYD